MIKSRDQASNTMASLVGQAHFSRACAVEGESSDAKISTRRVSGKRERHSVQNWRPRWSAAVSPVAHCTPEGLNALEQQKGSKLCCSSVTCYKPLAGLRNRTASMESGVDSGATCGCGA